MSSVYSLNFVSGLRTARSSSAFPQTILGLVLGFLMLWGGMATSFAQEKKEVAITLTANKVVTKEGKESLVSADQAKPGDIIEYTAVCVNKTGGKVRNLEPTVPIPAGTQYFPKSAVPAAAKATVDGGKFEALPIKRPATTPGGGVVEVPETEFKALRWLVSELDADQTAVVKLRVKVVSTPTPASSK